MCLVVNKSIVREYSSNPTTMSEASTNIFDDPNASHPLDLLINAISGSGEYQIPAEARGSEGEFDLEQLLNSSGGGQHDDGLDKVCIALLFLDGGLLNADTIGQEKAGGWVTRCEIQQDCEECDFSYRPCDEPTTTPHRIQPEVYAFYVLYDRGVASYCRAEELWEGEEVSSNRDLCRGAGSLADHVLGC